MRNAMRQGFTLLEMLVTLILLGILVAVVFPVVTQQIEEADPTKAANDLANIRTGIELFHVNVRPYYPADLDDLVNQIATTDGQLQDTTSTYSATEVLLWNGPYIDAAIPDTTDAQATGNAVETGFGGQIQNNLMPYDKKNDCPAENGGATTCAVAYSAANPLFASVLIYGLSSAQAQDINDLIDGPNEGTWQSEGKVRYNAYSSSDTNTLYYLAVPVK